jgi:F-type H+-transporting ATPase subunit b
MSKHIRICTLAIGLLLASNILFAQSGSQTSPAAATLSAQSAAAVQPTSIQKADAAPREEEEEENSAFKYSGVVRKAASLTGLSKEAMFWVFTIINFAILASAVGWIFRKALPNGFAPRTAEIQKAIEEARKASADASSRLSEIEGRLSRLDAEIATVRTAAEADFSVEEQRIKAAAEQDAKNVIAAAAQEIAAAARTAQRELKSYVAGLAVDLAEKKIKVDDTTDQALVRSFSAQIGKDGQ